MLGQLSERAAPPPLALFRPRSRRFRRVRVRSFPTLGPIASSPTAMSPSSTNPWRAAASAATRSGRTSRAGSG